MDAREIEKCIDEFGTDIYLSLIHISLMGIEVGTTVHFPMTTQELQAEIEQLISEKDGLYNTYHEQKQRFKELQTVKRNIDQILRREEPHRRKEQSHER